MGRNNLIANYLSYGVNACAYWNDKKITVPLGKTIIKSGFHLLDAILHFSPRKRCPEQNECTSFVAVLELCDEWR